MDARKRVAVRIRYTVGNMTRDAGTRDKTLTTLEDLLCGIFVAVCGVWGGALRIELSYRYEYEE